MRRLWSALILAALAAPLLAADGFRTEKHWRQHHAKHAAEFGEDVSAEEYLSRAKRLRDARADGKRVLEHRRRDGSRVKYDRATGEFGAYAADGAILTHFKPDSGERYFARQRRR